MASDYTQEPWYKDEQRRQELASKRLYEKEECRWNGNTHKDVKVLYCIRCDTEIEDRNGTPHTAEQCLDQLASIVLDLKKRMDALRKL